jgi:hypothetical protein
MINYLVTCKECSFTFLSDSTADVSSKGRDHRASHDRQHDYYWRQREERIKRVQEIDSQIRTAEVTLQYLESAPTEIEKLKDKLAELRHKRAMEYADDASTTI